MSTSSLEKQIAAALGGADATSADLAALIADTDAAISQADATAEAERTKALDPALSPDAKAAREALQAAEFSRDRLRTVLPRLRARLSEVMAAEYAARWEPEFQQIETQRDELATEYAQLYPKAVSELVDLFRRVEAVDKEVSRVNGSARAGEHRRLLGVELTARGLGNFTAADPSIARGVQLPDFERSSRMAWPPPQVPFAVLVAQSMVPAAHPGADWGQHNQERGQAMREEHTRIIAHYDAMAREREEREAAEDKERVRAIKEGRAIAAR